MNHPTKQPDPDQTQSLPITSREEAIKVLTIRPQIPDRLKKTFGAENMTELVDILMGEDLKEADLIGSTGALSEDALMQYVSLLPEYDEIEKKLYELIPKIMKRLKPQLGPAIQASKTNKRKGKVQDIYNDINYMYDTLENSVGGIRNLFTFRFTNNLYCLIFSALQDKFGFFDLPMFDRILNDLNEIWHKAYNGLDFIGLQFIREKTVYQDALAAYGKNLKEDLQIEESLSQPKTEELKEQLEADLLEIKELVEYRKIFFTPHKIGHE